MPRSTGSGAARARGEAAARASASTAPRRMSVQHITDGRRRSRRRLDVEAEVRGVAVAHDVVFAFDVELGGGAARGLGAELDEILPPDDLGLDEPALEVGVDGARRLRRLGALLDRPRAALGLARGEEGDEPERVVAHAHDLVQARLVEA